MTFSLLDMRNRSRQGFTIVELLIVIVVIAILAAITIVSYAGIQGRAYAVSVQSDIHNAGEQIEIFKLDNGYYPVTTTDLE
ncbi:MAG: type IV pilin protein [Candidatus Saccharimonadaceae bacterium]